MRERSLSGINTDLVYLRSCIEFVRPSEDHALERLHRVRGLLHYIPPVERDVIELHFFANKNQEQIGEALGLTQQAVSHRMRRAITRLAFLLDHPRLALWEIRRDMGRIWPGYPPIVPPMIWHFARTSSQTETAERLQVPQQHVRRHLAQACHYFQHKDSRVAKRYADMLARLISHRSILCEVPVPRRAYGGDEPRGHSPRRRLQDIREERAPCEAHA